MNTSDILKTHTHNTPRKVLILAYDFPPYVSVGGLRPYNWYLKFQELGFEPIIITRQWSNQFGNELDYISKSATTNTLYETTELGTIIRTPYTPNIANLLMLKHGEKRFRLVRKAFSALLEIAQYYLPVGTKRPIYTEANNYLKNNEVHAIIATGDPFVLFHYAKILSRKYNVKWIADYRDLWSIGIDNRKHTALTKLMTPIERRTVKSATVVTTVSNFLVNQLKSKLQAARIELVRNGYDQKLLTIQNAVTHDSGLHIGFAGSIYDWHPLDLVLQTCEQLRIAHPEIDIHFHFYGVNSQVDLRERLNQIYPSGAHLCSIFPKLENLELANNLKAHHLFLLFNDYAFCGTKIFDYLALRRPILFCFSDDEQATILKKTHFLVDYPESADTKPQIQIIQETNAGHVVSDSKELYQLLLQMHHELTATGELKLNASGIEAYARFEQTKILSSILDTL